MLATYRTSVTANMNLIGERFFWYRYRIVCSVTLIITVWQYLGFHLGMLRYRHFIGEQCELYIIMPVKAAELICFTCRYAFRIALRY